MGIGGTAMGSFAGLLKRSGYKVTGSDSKVYYPMKEKLEHWQIDYKTPYSEKNLPQDNLLVIVGNVIRRDNPESIKLLSSDLSYTSFPKALHELYLKGRDSIVLSGTHGKTTCSALCAHTLINGGRGAGFLIGGVPLNFNEGFHEPTADGPFVVEGDEYDTAFFDKQPKFMHYDPQFLLITSLEYDHADIYPDMQAIIDVFVKLIEKMPSNALLVINRSCKNLRKVLSIADIKAKVISYGLGGDYEAKNESFHQGGVSFNVYFHGNDLGRLEVPLYGEHNLSNALGVYSLVHKYGLSHGDIALGFKTFKGVKRRLEERYHKSGVIKVDDFAHHPTAVKETIKGARTRYPNKKICAIFEPRSATSCLKIFEKNYIDAFLEADEVFIAPVGRNFSPDKTINTQKIANNLKALKVNAQAFIEYEDLFVALKASSSQVYLFMSNGDFNGYLPKLLA